MGVSRCKEELWRVGRVGGLLASPLRDEFFEDIRMSWRGDEEGDDQRADGGGTPSNSDGEKEIFTTNHKRINR